MINESYLTEFNAPIRQIKGKVELFSSSTNTFIDEFTSADKVKNISIERLGEKGKFFGFGVLTKATIKLLDKNREININKDNWFNIAFSLNGKSYVYNFPFLNKPEVKRDENTNELTITAYDYLYAASGIKAEELELPKDYSIRTVAEKIAKALNLQLNTDSLAAAEYTTALTRGMNITGSETLRELLDDIAEATQTIYFTNQDELYFKKLDKDAAAALTIGKSSYFLLTSKEPKTLGAIGSSTELGDNVLLEFGEGVEQYVKDNVFWDFEEDKDTLLNAAAANIGNVSITPFTLNWRGNFLLEIGDKVDIVAKDNSILTSYILFDTITYNGGYSHKTEWSYEDTKTINTNSSTLGEVLKETSAKVDKQNKKIDLVVSESSANKSAISVIQQDIKSITTSVSGVESKVNSNTGAVEELSKKVSSTMTKEQIEHTITTELAKGTDKVTTTTGFTFNEEGLTISKSGSEISTTITDDGMAVTKGNKEVLTADNEGVKAIDLHAETYLIIGKNSRFEDYGRRTGCFWIGG